MRVCAEEIVTGKLKPETIELAVQLIRVNGFVLIEEVLPRTQIEQLNRSMEQHLANYMIKNNFSIEEGFHDGTNHIGMDLPFELPFCDEAIIAHPFVTAIVDEILGDDCVMELFASNTSMPKGKAAQAVHADMAPRFGTSGYTNLPITKLVVNFPLVDVTDENGPMEVWPGGTHLHPDRWYSSKVVDKSQLAQHMHSFKAYMPAGSIMIRDDRMWHRGTPNHSDKPRTNIALIYAASSIAHQQGRIQIPQETYDGLSEREKQLLRKEKIGFPVAVND